MNAITADPRVDRLYQLLPAIYRIRDAGQQYPLEALLRVIAEQVNVVEDDVSGLYENWFIETADDWVVPYIADLIGYRPVSEAGVLSDDRTAEERALNRVLIPRREVANTIRYRRRKGTLALLELLARDVAGWPAHAVEFFRLLGWNQNLNHLHLHRGRTVDVRALVALDRLDGPRDWLAHTVDVRRIDSHRTPGRYNIPSVGVFIWRLKSYSVARSPAYCAEDCGPNCMTFSALGQDAPLFVNPKSVLASSPPTVCMRADCCHLQSLQANPPPEPIRRSAFQQAKAAFYGVGKSFAIWADGWDGFAADQPIPVGAIVPADLTDWHYVPQANQIAVDPVLGRFVFPANQLPKKGVRVTYHYGFSADIGGGEYHRPLSQPANAVIFTVGPTADLKTIKAALDTWSQQDPKSPAAVVEINDSGVYTEQLAVTLQPDESLQIRAADGVRPILRLLDWQTDLPDALSFTMSPGSRLTLDGLLVTGRAIQVTGPPRDAPGEAPAPVCGAHLVIRHCTLVPGWGLNCDCEPKRPAEPSLELANIRARVCIEHSILGSVQIQEDEVKLDPIPVSILDSILDATAPDREALGAPDLAVAHALLTLRRCTVFGIINVHAIELAENCILTNCLNVARRQLGCMRFCYVPFGCRTPRRYHCQPDLVIQAVKQRTTEPAAQAAASAREQLRVRPQFTDTRYGSPGYCQLGPDCAPEIQRGADDESEMGVFHDLFQPQRAANLLARLEQYTPAGMGVGIIYAT